MFIDFANDRFAHKHLFKSVILMKKSIETQIKINTIVVYVVVFTLFIGLLAYIYSFRADLDRQKKNIELYSIELKTAESIIHQVEKAQSNVNLYAATKDASYRNNYIKNIAYIRVIVDSLRMKNMNPSDERTLKTLDSLLLMKGTVVSQLNEALAEKNLLVDINQFLRNYKPKELNSFFARQRQVERQDTVMIRKAPKKSFLKKVGALFSSKTDADSVKVKSRKVDETSPNRITVRAQNEIAGKIRRYVQQASSDYITQLSTIDNRVNELVTADQQITTKISSSLINYFTELIHARYDEIHRSDELIKQNNNYTLIGGLIALIPIVFSFVTILNNVNRGKRARVALEKANARIREVMESRHQLLLSVSHDIKTPLNSIMGNLDLNKNGKIITESDVNSMQNSGKHILSLLDNLLGFSSIEQGKMALQPTSFHLYELCSEIQEMFIPLCQKKNLHFYADFDFDKHLIVNTDNLKLKQIIINLLSNAVKYTVKGDVKFKVAYKDNNISVLVKDSGVGVAKDQLNKIFEPFVRVEENNKIAEGSGFGMFVVKGLVELFGGSINANSEVAKGTEFSVQIPASSIIPDSSGDKIKQILLVDDDSALLLTLKSMTEKLGHKADVCLSMDELKKNLPEIGKYDVVLTDMEMGTHSGLDVLELVRKVNADIPVVLTTARSEIKEEQVKMMGFSSCLPKPISLDVLSILLGQFKHAEKNVNEIVEEKPFSSLKELFGDDENAMRDVLLMFKENSQNDIAELANILQNKDFDTAQHKCHKMLSMFMQVDATNSAIPLLKKMDFSRSDAQKSYEGWENDVRAIVEATGNLIEEINGYLRV